MSHAEKHVLKKLYCELKILAAVNHNIMTTNKP